jgi:tetratricopeptide (TPR) repeat protein
MLPSMGVHFERAQLLFEQSRFEPAERELRQELAREPDNAMAHALLGLCLAEVGQYDRALASLRLAIHLAPDLAFAHYALADVLHDRNDLDGARAAVSEALRLDPEMPNYFGLLANVEMKQKRWADALVAAERGLVVDPEHVGCGNMRALALVKLRRPAEAAVALQTALAHDPSNAVTHANQGWALLHEGKSAPALHHFREALRLDSDFEMARQGVVESLKVRFVVYRLLLRFFLWLGRLSGWIQWGVIVGGFVGYWILQLLAYNKKIEEVYVWPILGAYLGLGLAIWIADSLFNLLLRLDRSGRLALSHDQVIASNWLGACLLGVAVMAILWLITSADWAARAAAASGLMTLPVAGVFDCPPGWKRRVMAGYAVVLAAVGLIGVTSSAETIKEAYVFQAFVAGAFLSGCVTLALLAGKQRPESRKPDLGQ